MGAGYYLIDPNCLYKLTFRKMAGAEYIEVNR